MMIASNIAIAMLAQPAGPVSTSTAVFVFVRHMRKNSPPCTAAQEPYTSTVQQTHAPMHASTALQPWHGGTSARRSAAWQFLSQSLIAPRKLGSFASLDNDGLGS
jgi:hypothetical protein